LHVCIESTSSIELFLLKIDGARDVVGILRGAVSGKTDGIGSSCEVNWLIDGRCGKALPAIDLAHVDLAGSK
jgi:hypothetical protein